MENPRRFSGGEVKLPLSEWKEAVIRGVAGSTPVDVFLMFYNTWSIVILSVENGKIVRREEPTEDYDDPMYEDPPYDPLDKMFRRVLNTGTIIYVGKEGTYFDYEVRFGVVSRSGMIWLKDGKESDVINVLTELVESSMPVSEEDEMQDSRQGSNSSMYIPRPKRDIAVGWAHQLAALMLRIPDWAKVAIVRGMGSDGKPFYFYTVPMIDELAYRNWGYMYSGATNTQDDTRMNNGTDIHDRYSAFDNLASKTGNAQQYCWAHIISDTKELEDFYGEEGRRIRESLQRIYDKSKSFNGNGAHEDIDHLYERLTFLLDTGYNHLETRKFADNLIKRRKEWLFKFVIDPEVEPTKTGLKELSGLQ